MQKDYYNSGPNVFDFIFVFVEFELNFFEIKLYRAGVLFLKVIGSYDKLPSVVSESVEKIIIE